MPGDDKQYCICCGERVPVARIPKEGRVEMACIYCGFVLDSETVELSQSQVPEEASAPAPSAPPGPVVQPGPAEGIAPVVRPESVESAKAEEPPVFTPPAPPLPVKLPGRSAEELEPAPAAPAIEEFAAPPPTAEEEESGPEIVKEPEPRHPVQAPQRVVRPGRPKPGSSNKGKPFKSPGRTLPPPARPIVIPKSFRTQAPAAPPVREAAPPSAPPRPAAERPVPPAACILAADDVELTRDLVKGMLLKSGLTQEVIMTGDGQEFVQAYTRRIVEDQETTIAILDIEMPIMDGITAARVMRAVETQYHKKPVSIIFFSALKCDEPLRKQLAIFSPASYINKGSDSDPAKLMERIERLIGYILARRRARSL